MHLLIWFSYMFVQAYFIRRVLIKFFLMQVEAEKNKDALTQLLDDLPDAVLVLEKHCLTYCNQLADKIFEVDLS